MSSMPLGCAHPLHPQLLLCPERDPGCPQGPRAVRSPSVTGRLLQPVSQSPNPPRSVRSVRSPSHSHQRRGDAGRSGAAMGISHRCRGRRAGNTAGEQRPGPRHSHSLAQCHCGPSRGDTELPGWGMLQGTDADTAPME